MYCLKVDATQATRAANGRAAGLIFATNSPNAARLAALGITNWRVAANVTASSNACTPTDLDLFAYRTAVTANTGSGVPTTTTILLSDVWHQFTGPSNGGKARAPWNDWTCYDTFVQTLVSLFRTKATQQGLPVPDYWEPQNEPDDLSFIDGYFSEADQANANRNNILALFDHAYTYIKAADATAKTMGPSLDGFAGYPGQQPSPATIQVLGDLQTFLDYSDTHDLHWDAISWHENDDRLNTDWTNDPQEYVANHVATARSLLARHPSLGSPKIIINEFGASDRWVAPGWQGGVLSVMESAGVDFAAHSCFNTANAGGPQPIGDNNCFATPSTLDGLVGTDVASSTYSSYWVAAAYASMTYDVARGERASVVTSLSSSPNIGVFATLQAGTSTVTVLAGRNETCLGHTANADCPSGSSAPPPATNVPLEIKFPYSAPNGVRVIVKRIYFVAQNGFLLAPVLASNTIVSLTSGQLAIVLPGVADGDALTVTVSPA